jgi:hypothetical protein
MPAAPRCERKERRLTRPSRGWVMPESCVDESPGTVSSSDSGVCFAMRPSEYLKGPRAEMWPDELSVVRRLDASRDQLLLWSCEKNPDTWRHFVPSYRDGLACVCTAVVLAHRNPRFCVAERAASVLSNVTQLCLLRCSFAGASPKINRPLLRIAINLIRVCIRELQFSNCIERVVELLHITSSDEHQGDPQSGTRLSWIVARVRQTRWR